MCPDEGQVSLQFLFYHWFCSLNDDYSEQKRRAKLRMHSCQVIACSLWSEWLGLLTARSVLGIVDIFTCVSAESHFQRRIDWLLCHAFRRSNDTQIRSHRSAEPEIWRLIQHMSRSLSGSLATMDPFSQSPSRTNITKVMSMLDPSPIHKADARALIAGIHVCHSQFTIMLIFRSGNITRFDGAHASIKNRGLSPQIFRWITA